MRMKAEDLLKLGLLYIQQGKWNGVQLVSERWIQEACTEKFTTYKHIGSYGFHWWTLDKRRCDVPCSLYFAMGYGGQYIIVVPELQLTTVISSHMPKKGLVPLRLFVDWLKEYHLQRKLAIFRVSV